MCASQFFSDTRSVKFGRKSEVIRQTRQKNEVVVAKVASCLFLVLGSVSSPQALNAWNYSVVYLSTTVAVRRTVVLRVLNYYWSHPSVTSA